MTNRGIRRVARGLRTRQMVAAAATIVVVALGASAWSAGAAVSTATSAITSLTLSDDTDPAVVYSGNWRVTTSGGTRHTLTGSGSALLRFAGTSVAWTGIRSPASGIAEIYIDGTRVASVDGYATTTAPATMFQTAGLTDAPHTLEVRSTGARNPASSSNEIVVDTIGVGTAAIAPSASPTPPPTSSASPSPTPTPSASASPSPSTSPSPSASPTPSPAPSASPFGIYGRPLDVDPNSSVATSVANTASANERAALQPIASRPIANWFGDWNSDITSAIRQRVSAADARGAIATLVMYDIPNRDCGSYSATRVATADQYRAWVRSFVAGLAQSRAIVIVEPDALLLTDCLSAAQVSERYGLIRYAVDLISTQGSWAYIDAGHNQWLGAAETARRLQLAGVSGAAGFSLDVSNFKATNLLVDFGTDVSARSGGAHFVIDTSRNGRPLTTGDWCNPTGMGLGIAPTVRTASPLADAYLWIKAPGESDGPCNGGPAAGQWFPAYALALVRGAAAG